MAGPLAKKELPAERSSKRNGKREEGSRQKKISNDRQHHDKGTVCSYEKEGWEEGRVGNAEFAVKDLPVCRTLWLIEFEYANSKMFNAHYIFKENILKNL